MDTVYLEKAQWWNRDFWLITNSCHQSGWTEEQLWLQTSLSFQRSFLIDRFLSVWCDLSAPSLWMCIHSTSAQSVQLKGCFAYHVHYCAHHYCLFHSNRLCLAAVLLLQIKRASYFKHRLPVLFLLLTLQNSFFFPTQPAFSSDAAKSFPTQLECMEGPQGPCGDRSK